MKNQKRIQDYGFVIGDLPTGPRNAITDVAGIRVGHVTLDNKDVKTGVTAIIPHNGDMFNEKVAAAAHVINGYGKSVGTIQIEELGTIETPIVLTNTLNIGEACSGLIDYMLDKNKDIGKEVGTVNPIVGECNDGYLNDIRGKHVNKHHVIDAIANADIDFLEGAVGAGTGMSCYELKGGIGTASRIVRYGGKDYTVGVLVLTNMGKIKDLMICGQALGQKIDSMTMDKKKDSPDGSIIMVIATDMPLSVRQLKRISKRTVVGLSRTGSYIGHGSGEIVFSFTTANKISHNTKESISSFKIINESKMDLPFRAVAECTEEAILNSMITAKTTAGKDGHIRKSLKEYL